MASLDGALPPEMRRAVLYTPLTDIAVPDFLRKHLRDMEIVTIGDLVLTSEDALDEHGVDQWSIQKIYELLDQYGLSLIGPAEGLPRIVHLYGGAGFIPAGLMRIWVTEGLDVLSNIYLREVETLGALSLKYRIEYIEWRKQVTGVRESNQSWLNQAELISDGLKRAGMSFYGE